MCAQGVAAIAIAVERAMRVCQAISALLAHMIHTVIQLAITALHEQTKCSLIVGFTK